MSEGDHRFFVAVKGLIWHEGTFLIIRRSGQARDGEGYWELPGGRLEFTETPEEALHRELREEVGLAVEIQQPLFTWTFLRGASQQTVGITFRCSTATRDVTLSPEHDAHAWLRPEEITQYPFAPDVLRDLERWSGCLNESFGITIS